MTPAPRARRAGRPGHRRDVGHRERLRRAAPRRGHGGCLHGSQRRARQRRRSGDGRDVHPVRSRDRAASDQVGRDGDRLGVGGLDVLVPNAGILFRHDRVDARARLPRARRGQRDASSAIPRACFAPMRDRAAGSMVVIASDTAIRGNPRDRGVLGHEGRRRSPSRSSSPPRARRSDSLQRRLPGRRRAGRAGDPEGTSEHAEEP